MDDGITWLNALTADDGVRELLACCAATRWAHGAAAARPYPSRSELLDSAAVAISSLPWSDVREALDAHPRIGDRVAGAAREAGWSRQEQSGVDAAGDDTVAALAEGNRAYEKRFGHVFLICATGKSAEEMLAVLRARLGNSPIAEQDVVRTELAAITRLRLARLLDGAAARIPPPQPASGSASGPVTSP